MGTHPIFESDFDCLTEEMDYDDELRESCDKTGDLLHCRTNCAATNDKEGEMDEFAAEMESELDELLMTAQAQWTKDDKNATSPKLAQADQPTTSKSANELYEKDYFDSSDEEEDSSDRRKKLTNDELLYDPEADEDDAKWMAEHSSKKADGSDAVLNCPACLTVICVDCQRHEKYHTQYRAMFVLNCKINDKEVLRYKKKKRKTRNRKKEKIQDRRRKSRSRSRSLNRASDATDTDAEDLYHPVTCKICDSELGVFDPDE